MVGLEDLTPQAPKYQLICAVSACRIKQWMWARDSQPRGPSPSATALSGQEILTNTFKNLAHVFNMLCAAPVRSASLRGWLTLKPDTCFLCPRALCPLQVISGMGRVLLRSLNTDLVRPKGKSTPKRHSTCPSPAQATQHAQSIPAVWGAFPL